MKSGYDSNATIHAAAFGAAALIAGQVAGKAVRDAFFLSNFDVSALPDMVILAALVSIAAGLATTRLLTVFSPARLLPLAFVSSAVLLVAEWWVAAWNPGAAAILIYLQMAITGSVLISGFWSLLDDRFDAGSAKKQFGRIVAAGALGGVVGGLLAERVGSLLGIANMLPVLAFLHLVCALIATSLSSERAAVAPKRISREQIRKSPSGFAVLYKAPYVRNLALLILFSTVGTGLLDYAFKVRLSAVEGDQLVRLFALFYATIGVATFLVQLVLSRVAVDRLGIAGTVGSLPLSLAVGGLGGLLIPGLPMAFAMRGGEAMARSSFFKSGYEMLYAAVPRRERRATKSILDVGVERTADLAGAVLLGAISWTASPHSLAIVLSLASALGIAGFWISRRLQDGYVQALENSLLTRSIPGAVSLSLATHAGDTRVSAGRADSKSEELHVAGVPTVRTDVRDPILSAILDLRSSDPLVVRRRLREPLPAVFAAYVVALLAWDEVSAEAIEALKKMGPKITGQLVDALLDPEQEFAIRRRIPRVIGTFDEQRAADGLAQALEDRRFEVRFHAGRALTQIKERQPGTVLNHEGIIRAVEREFEISPEVWRHHRVLDATHETREGSLPVEHVFRLLALVYSREPLQAAYRALKSGDDHLRRTSLEYLEQILPLGVWQRILPLVEERRELVAAGR